MKFTFLEKCCERCCVPAQERVLRGQQSTLAGLSEIESQQRHMLTAASDLWELAQRNAAELGSAQQRHSDAQQQMLQDLR